MPEELYSAATARALELPDLLAVVAELAATDVGREAVLGLEPLAGEEDLGTRRRRLEEVLRLIGEGPLVPSFEGSVHRLFERLVTGRPPIGGAELVRLGDFLRTTRRAAERVTAADPPCPELTAAAAELPDLSELERGISRVLDRRGNVREDASPELEALRGKIRRVRDRLYQELTSYVSENREALSEETVPLRDGRLVVVLQAGSRGRLSGLTHGRSASGKSFYFEPLEVVESNNALSQAMDDEEAERLRLINDLVTRARSAREELDAHLGFLAELDLLQAAARFAETSGGRLAEISTAGRLRLVGGRHPLLDPRLAELRREALGQPGHLEAVVPLDLELEPESRALVLTGPNAGGKTVALKTVGLLALATQCGLPVPAAAGTCFPVLDRLVGIVGDEQDLLTDRSTFSGRLLRLKEAWEAAGPASLLLLDELGSGTDPEEGSALAVALLEGLLQKGGLAVITTHLTPLAAAALELPGAACAAMELDAATGEPTFRVAPGPPGGSEALALARRLGLPGEWLDRAEARLGSEHRDLRRLLAEVEGIRSELAGTRDRLRQEADDAEKLRRRLDDERQTLAAEKKTLGKRLRAELDDFRRRTTERLREEVERLRAELEEGRRKGLAAEAAARLFAEAPELPAAEPEGGGGPLEVGGPVRHLAFGWEGTLERLDGERAEVAVRGKRLRCRAGELTAVARGNGRRPAAPGVSVRVSDPLGDAPREINLIGRRVEPALEELDTYLDRALVASLPEVRVVHGHGSGRLRRAVREHLRAHPAVAAHRPGGEHEGGDGATVVRLAKG